jgi:integrase
MGRHKKIWRRKATGHWYTTEGTRKIKVADKSLSYRDAFDRFKLFHVSPTHGTITVKRLADDYLEWCKVNRAEATYVWYQSFLKPFCATLNDKLRVIDAKIHHVQKWLDSTGWNDNTKNGATRAILRCFNWGVKQGLISANPFYGIERPSRTPREVVIDDKQFTKLLTFVRPEFGDYLTFLYESGCRPQEIRLLAAEHWDGEKFVLQRRNSKGKVYPRVIYPNAKMRRLVKRLIKKYAEGPIFRNADGEPWKANAVRSRFSRLQGKMKIEGLCATSLRHSYCTNALKRGMDTTTVALLMGHRDTAMVARVYQHLAKDHAYLSRAAERATSGGIVPLVLPTGLGTLPTAIH